MLLKSPLVKSELKDVYKRQSFNSDDDMRAKNYYQTTYLEPDNPIARDSTTYMGIKNTIGCLLYTSDDLCKKADQFTLNYEWVVFAFDRTTDLYKEKVCRDNILSLIHI